MWAPPRRAASATPGGAPAAPSASAPLAPQGPLHHLLQMGFPRHRAVKALAATGNRSVRLASDWLLTHVSDSTLDEDIPREYILYACPTGPLFDQLQQFWAKSKELCGWNGAHNYIPHITLVSFFKAPDECCLQLSKVLKHIVETVGQPPDDFLNLEPYISPNFMGLFVSEKHAEYLKNIAVQYVKQVSSSIGLTVDTYEQLDALATCFPWCAVPQEPPQPSICLEPHVKSLHITLAYQFPSNAYSNLKELAENLQPVGKSLWEIRLYSRDPRLSTHQVHKVKHIYNSRENDELELRHGDYIYIDENMIQNSLDGWVQGISWLTGMTGYLPMVYTERTAESDAWTLHRAVPLESQTVQESKPTCPTATSDDSLLQMANSADESVALDTESRMSSNKSELNISEWDVRTAYVKSEMDNFLSKAALNSEPEDGKKTIENSSSNGDNITENTSKERDILVMRHGERVDFTYGSWAPYCFDDEDNYIRKDMNMPPTLPLRSGGSGSYTSDCPLTMVGLLQARLVGEGLKLANVTLSHVYSSPSYRCIQTAQAMLEGLGSPASLKIKVEPSLFEWLVWYSKGPPLWMTNDELKAADMNIDEDYESFMKVGESPFIQISEDSECLEDCAQFYERNSNFAIHALKQTEQQGGTIMLVGHASTLDTVWRGISGLGPRDYNSLGRLMRAVPYCSLAAIKGPPWNLAPPPCPPLMNTSNKRFDWKLLKE